jgi:hypothetical protein
MKQISSKSQFVIKWFFPIFWFGMLAIMVAMPFVVDGPRGAPPLFFVIPCVMAVGGCLFLKFMVWDLADKVYDCGDHLLVSRHGEEESVPFSNIMNVSAAFMMNPPRITLRLVQPGKFGDEIAFSPAASLHLNPFAKNPIVEDLIVRVDQARVARRGL